MNSDPSAPLPRGGLLALDWGQKKVGFATVDELGLVVTPRGHFARKGIEKISIWKLSDGDLKALHKLHADYECGGFVLGLPLGKDGRENEASEGARSLAKILEKEFELPVHLVNEALTSWDSKGAPDEDAEAAAHLLRDFLFQQNQKKDFLE